MDRCSIRLFGSIPTIVEGERCVVSKAIDQGDNTQARQKNEKNDSQPLISFPIYQTIQKEAHLSNSIYKTSYCKPILCLPQYSLQLGMQHKGQDPRIQAIRSKGRHYPNFPKEGVTFLDIFPIIGDPQCLQLITQLFAERLSEVQFDRICMLQSKGFILGPILAMRVQKPCFPLRKKGKLPGECAALKYSLQYGADEMEIQKENVREGEKIVIIDDVLATGGTLNAAIHLLQQEGAVVAHILCLNRVVAAKGIERIKLKPQLIYCIYDT